MPDVCRFLPDISVDVRVLEEDARLGLGVIMIVTGLAPLSEG